MPEIDDRDRELIAQRQEALLRRDPFEPRVGDAVVFADGRIYRISHVWDDGVQTSSGGSFHLGASGYMSFSGSLYRSIPLDKFTHRPGAVSRVSAWMFHHDWAERDNGVYFTVDVPIWMCSEAAPSD